MFREREIMDSDCDERCQSPCIVCLDAADKASQAGPYRPLWPGDPKIRDGLAFFGFCWYSEEDLDPPDGIRL
jgi:hypothetical protein